MSRTPLALLAGALLLLAGCSAGTVDDTLPASEEPAATETEALVDPSDPGCLIGDWTITQSELQSFYDAVSAEVEGIAFAIEGGTGLSFTASEYRYTPAFTLVLDAAGLSGEGVTTGSLGGTWSATGGVITTAVASNDLSTQVTVNGMVIDASEVIGGVIASDPINNTPFDCSDPGAPVLHFEVSESARTPVTLTRAG